MASTNQSPEYLAAEKRFLFAGTDEEKLLALEEMMRYCPKHKSGEAMRANLRTRYKKLKEKIETEQRRAKANRAGKQGIKKAEMQACLIGLTQSGKSSILASLTNAKPEISPVFFTTKQPNIGMMNYEDIQIQIIDLPAIESEYFDQGIVNITDTLLIIITNPKELEQIFPFIEKAQGKKLIIFNKIDLLNQEEKRKIDATLKSKKFDYVLFSAETKENFAELKKQIWLSFNKIRVYTKQPGRKPDDKPIIMKQDSTIEQAAEKIFHRKIDTTFIKEAKITGPSSKFSNQKVSLAHELKDKDIVEFRTR